MVKGLKIGLAICLCALVLALGLSAMLLSCHCCVGVDCAICAALDDAMNLTRLAGIAAVFSACALSAACLIRAEARRSCAGTRFTLVGAKCELLN